MDAQCISNTTRVCPKALEKHFFLLDVRKHGGPPTRHDKQSRWRRSTLLVLPGAALLGATSQV